MNLQKKKPFVLRFWHVVAFLLTWWAITSIGYDVNHRYIKDDLELDRQYVVDEKFETMSKSSNNYYIKTIDCFDDRVYIKSVSLETYLNIDEGDRLTFSERNESLNNFLLVSAVLFYFILGLAAIVVVIVLLIDSISKHIDENEADNDH